MLEFKLNKIDTDIRKKIEEERNTSKVQSGKGINVNRDLKDNNLERKIQNKREELKKKKKFFMISAVKYSKREIKVDVEKNENLTIQNSLGRILDSKQ